MLRRDPWYKIWVDIGLHVVGYLAATAVSICFVLEVAIQYLMWRGVI